MTAIATATVTTAVNAEERVRDTLAVLGWLRHQFPAWVAWCDANREWTATRPPRFGENPSAGGCLVWVRASTSEELAARMDGRTT